MALNKGYPFVLRARIYSKYLAICDLWIPHSHESIDRPTRERKPNKRGALRRIVDANNGLQTGHCLWEEVAELLETYHAT